MTDRRKDQLFKALLIAMCGFSGAGGGWGGSKISQAEILLQIKAQGEKIVAIQSEVQDLRKSKVDVETHKAADDAQDKRIGDIMGQLDQIHADVRTLISMQQGRR